MTQRDSNRTWSLGAAGFATTDLAAELAESFVRHGLLPSLAAMDALHISTATVNEMNVLLTWNCKHLANAEVLPDLTAFIRSQGYEPPIICTPDELMGE